MSSSAEGCLPLIGLCLQRYFNMCSYLLQSTNAEDFYILFDPAKPSKDNSFRRTYLTVSIPLQAMIERFAQEQSNAISVASSDVGF
jgi:hypothetical protein